MKSSKPSSSGGSDAKKKAFYTKQRLDAEAEYKKTGKKSATYKSLEKKGYEKPKSGKSAPKKGGSSSSVGDSGVFTRGSIPDKVVGGVKSMAGKAGSAMKSAAGGKYQVDPTSRRIVPKS